MKLINRKGKVLLIFTVAASLVGGGTYVLGALGTKLGLNESTVDRTRRQHHERAPR
jgi:hypothetical protein